jgi:hypothetical protein
MTYWGNPGGILINSRPLAPVDMSIPAIFAVGIMAGNAYTWDCGIMEQKWVYCSSDQDDIFTTLLADR